MSESATRTPFWAGFVFLLLCVTPGCLKADTDPYDEKLVGMINRCNAIPEKETVSLGIGVLPASPSYYRRSQCFYKLAIEERRPELCAHVKRLQSPQYTAGNCREKVEEKIVADRAYAESFNGVHHTIEKARFRRNNNGRDFDFVITITGDKRICYLMEWTIGSRVLYSDSETFFAERAQKFYYLPKKDLLNKLKGLPIDQPHTVTITLTKNIGRYANRYLSEQNKVIEETVPVTFSELQRVVERFEN